MSLMGGLDFDIGFSFDKFEENVKRFIELPKNYLDTAVDTAVEFMEDIHERMFAPSPSDEALNKANEILKDSFYDNVITGSSATSVRMEFVASNKELSSPSTSTVTAEDSFAGSVVADAPETESILTKSPESDSSEGGNIEVNEQCMLPVDTSAAEISGGKSIDVDEEVLSGNSEKPSDSCTSEDPISIGKELILWRKPLEPQSPESSAFDDAIIPEGTIVNCEEPEHSTKDTEESGKHGDLSKFSGVTISHDLTTDMSNDDDSNVWLDIDLQDDQEQTEADVSPVRQPKKTSFKKKMMRSLANKFRWSKKERNLNQAEAGNVRYQAVSSSDDLEDDWELL
ncbi:uncharacterized protein [Oryza sativa Japonica Group]|nr:uncharacterized protein LOC107278500 [Oryza sativa Japonica Group]KAF2949086.1 hypothetical protein DAI22_01g082300 [Oryza sativa Japonica Group]